MKKHWSYLQYVLRHKWFVFRAGLKTKAPLLRLLFHDCSKFLPSEWNSYAEYFYGSWRNTKDQQAFVRAEWPKRAVWLYSWLRHIHRNPHHWEHWVIYRNEGKTEVLEMPEKFVREMVADWIGTGYALEGRRSALEWWEKNRENILFHPQTRPLVVRLVHEVNL